MPAPSSQAEALERVAKIVEWLVENPESGPFRQPVEWQEFASSVSDQDDELSNDYLYAIGGKTNLMDLGTIQAKLERQEYVTAAQCMKDVRQVWKNCIAFNEHGSDFWLLARMLGRRAEDRYRRLRKEFDVGSEDPTSERFDKNAKKSDTIRDSMNTNDAGSAKVNDDGKLDSYLADTSSGKMSADTTTGPGKKTINNDDDNASDALSADSIASSQRQRNKRQRLTPLSMEGNATNVVSSSTNTIATRCSQPTTLDARARFASMLLQLDGPDFGAIVELLEQDYPHTLDIVCPGRRNRRGHCQGNDDDDCNDITCEYCRDCEEHVEINIDAMNGRLLLQLTQFAAHRIARRQESHREVVLPSLMSTVLPDTNDSKSDIDQVVTTSSSGNRSNSVSSGRSRGVGSANSTSQTDIASSAVGDTPRRKRRR